MFSVKNNKENCVPIVLSVWVEDKEQFFLLESLAEDTEKQQKLLDENIHVKVMLEAARGDIEKLKKDVEKLKDATRDIQFSNGNGNGNGY